MRKAKMLISAVFLGLMLIVTGCGASETSGSKSNGNSKESDETAKLDFPKKPIKIIVPWAAGGGTDVFVRVISELGPKYFDEAIVVENKEGAGGTVGLAEAKKQPADGYTLVATSGGLFSTHPHLREVQYGLEDFVPVQGMHYSPQIFVVNGDSPYNTIEELVDDAKKNNKTINYAAPGAMSVGHLAMSTFFDNADVKSELVPYQGHGPAVAALLGGHVDAIVVFPADVADHAKDSTVKVLGTFTQERLEDLPDVPTMIESGYGEGVENHDFESWFFLAAPKDTPEEIVNYLDEKFAELLKDPEIEKYSKNAHQPVRPESGEEVLKRVEDEIDVYNKIIPNVEVEK